MNTNRSKIQVGSLTFYGGNSRTQYEWETSVQELLNKGEPFQAYDLAQISLRQFPDSLRLKQMTALALIRTGGIEEARKILEPLCPGIYLDEKTLNSFYTILQRILGLFHQTTTDIKNEEEKQNAFAKLLIELGGIGKFMIKGDVDEETMGLLGRIYKDFWKRTGDPKDALLCRDIYFRTFIATKSYWCGINAAMMSLVIGEKEKAKDLAKKVFQLCESSEKGAEEAEQYWIKVTQGEAQLILENYEEALKNYNKALNLSINRYDQIISSHQQIQLYMDYDLIDFPDEILNELFKILKPPTIVSFTGHMIDKLEREKPRFPSSLEKAVHKAIEKKLDELDVKIGFSSAACGADIIFIESMLDRGAEVNIILPFNLDDFIKTSVEFAGPEWVTRFNKVIKLANSVRYVTKERYLGHDSLFNYTGKVINGYAYLRADYLLTSPHLIAVLDPYADRLVGGATSIVDKWSNKELCHIINIQDFHKDINILDNNPSDGMDKPKTSRKEIIHSISKKREIYTMLFADIVGYSKLKEVDYPHFYDFLKEVAEQLKEFSIHSKFINTWGDAIFTVMDKAIPLIEYAFTLNDAVNNADHINLKLPEKMNIRIALHAGPAFEIKDPITGNKNVYGSHVNRAARIEPVTLPGHIYASEQFVAQLVSEQVEYEYEAVKNNKLAKCIFALEYVGSMKLHKDFGLQSVYHIRKRTEHERKLLSINLS